MSNFDKNDISELLKKWAETKKEISSLEKKCDKYKKYIDAILENNNSDTVSSNEYILKKKIINKSTLSKNDVPKDIWNKYSKSCSYPAYFLTSTKTKKRSK
jgi:hypothetical protein